MHVSSGFPPEKMPGTRAITNSGQLQNNCPLFVRQNQGNFMQSVITGVNKDLKLLAKFHSGTLRIMDTMRLMSLFGIIAQTPIGIRLNMDYFLFSFAGDKIYG